MAMTTLTHLQGGKGKGKGEKANQEVGDQDGDKNLMKVKICDKNFMFCLTKSLWRKVFDEKHQDWEDLRGAVDEVGHLGWDALVQCVQIRGEPADWKCQQCWSKLKEISTLCWFKEVRDLLTIRPTGVVSKKLRGACMVAWTEKEQSFLILVFGKPWLLAPTRHTEQDAFCWTSFMEKLRRGSKRVRPTIHKKIVRLPNCWGT